MCQYVCRFKMFKWLVISFPCLHNEDYFILTGYKDNLIFFNWYPFTFQQKLPGQHGLGNRWNIGVQYRVKCYIDTINAPLRRHSSMSKTYKGYNLSLIPLKYHNCFNRILLIEKGTNIDDVMEQTFTIPAQATVVSLHRNTTHCFQFL